MTTTMLATTPIKSRRAGFKPTLDSTKPPPRVDRRHAAQLLFDKLGLNVSSRTLETWPLKARLLNGRATYDTVELLEFARKRIETAPQIRGGRKRS